MNAVGFAKANGFEGARFLGNWNGYRCYNAIYRETEYKMSDDRESVTVEEDDVGYPQYILEKNGKFRFADYDEAMTILNRLE